MISIKVNKNFYDDVTAEMIRFYRENPSLAALDLLKVDLHPVQQVILEDCWKRKYTTTVACRGTGKCTRGDNIIPTENGFFEIKDLGNELIPISNLDILIQGINGPEKSSKWYYDGVQDVFDITTSMGYTTGVTPDHKLIILDDDGKLVWKKSKDIQIGDYLVLDRKNEVWASKDCCSREDALFLGLLVGDGSFSSEKLVIFTNGDEDTLDKCEEIGNTFNPSTVTRKKDSRHNCSDIRFYGKEVWDRLEKLGVKKNTYSYNKEIPKAVLRSGPTVVSEFLKGLFETDGGVERYTVSYCTKSKKLAKQVHVLLLALGIVSRLKDKKIKYKNEYRTYFSIEISSSNVDIFAEKIGFLSERKKVSLKNILSKNRNVNKDLIPNQEKLFESIWNKTRNILPNEKRARLFRFKNGSELPSYDAVKKEIIQYPFEDELKQKLLGIYNSNFYFDKVVDISIGLDKVYDLVVPGTNSFTGNGFINHNTFLAGGVIAPLFSILYPGTRIGFISSSFRQCLTGDSVVFTEEDGFIKIKDIYSKPSKILSQNGLRDCEDFWENIPQRTVKISTSCGFKLEGLPEHRILVIDNSGTLVYKELNDIKENDCAVLKFSDMVFGKKTDLTIFHPNVGYIGNTRPCLLPNNLDEQFSYVLGLLIGDGCVSSKNYIHYVSVDTQLIDVFEKTMLGYLGTFNRSVREDGLIKLSKGSKEFYEFLVNVGIGGKKSNEKDIPQIVKSSNIKNISACIRGIFDTDGFAWFNKTSSHKYKIGISSSSDKLIDSLKILFLNYGIKFYCNTSEKIYDEHILKGRLLDRNHKVTTLEISEKSSILAFNKYIGFGLKRKQDILDSIVDDIINGNIYRSNFDIIPNIENKVREVLEIILQKGFLLKDIGIKDIYKIFDSNLNYSGRKITKYIINRIISFTDKNCIKSPKIEYLRDISNNYHFDYIKTISNGFDYTYDFTVSIDSNYISNGFISHNSRFLFEKAEETYFKSSIFRQACKGDPKRNPDSYRIDLKPAGIIPPGKIEAIPIGTDGAKIRGARYGLIAIDEFAQVPKGIFDKVISPMASTSLDPMVAVRLRQKLFKQLKSGLITEEQYEASLNEATGSVNRIFVFSSGYYQFNHLYERFEAQRRLIKDGNKNYAIHQISYREIPEGFLEKEGIENARQTLSTSDFMMEYEGEFVPDSEGVFKASLIESRRNGMANNVWDKSVKLSSESRCVMGIDPARSHDYCAIVIIEIGNPNQVVYAWNVRGMDFPAMAKHVHTLFHKFNVCEIYIDKLGGGQAIADILATMDPPLADKDDELRMGKKVITLVHPSNMETNRAVNDSKSLLEQGKLWFPASPSVVEHCDSSKKEEVYQTVQLMISQLTSIVATSTSTGQVHFDVPGGTKDKDGIKKDLFSAFILAGKACFDLTERPKEQVSILYPFGFIRNRY